MIGKCPDYHGGEDNARLKKHAGSIRVPGMAVAVIWVNNQKVRTQVVIREKKMCFMKNV